MIKNTLISNYLTQTLYCCFIFCSSYSQIPAFPGAEGFGALATGGRGGKVIYVTNLNVSGPGSLQAALNETGKRYILFKVSGIIQGTMEVGPGRGDYTLAGQTSPSGIIVRGFQSYNGDQKSSSNMIIRHLRSRIGDRIKYPTQNWLAEDGITLGGVSNTIIDHCSFAHAIDEAVDISRSSGLTIQNCMLAETLGGHADLGGMLINYSSPNAVLDSLSIHHNLWNRIGGRMPEISCETSFCNNKTIQIELSNNLFWDPRIELWYEGTTTNNGSFYLKMNAVNNYTFAKPTFGNAMFHYDMLTFNQNQLYFSGNQMNLYPLYKDYQLFYCCNDFPTSHPNVQLGVAQKSTVRYNFPNIQYHNTSELRNYMVKNVGAFPRDIMDKRLLETINSGIIDNKSQNVDHYGDTFISTGAELPPLDTDGDGMPDYWETSFGLNTSVQDHNQTQLSTLITGIAGYTNLECYLNCMSDALVDGASSSACKIKLGNLTSTDYIASEEKGLLLAPNPVLGNLDIRIEGDLVMSRIIISDASGKCIFDQNTNNTKISLSTHTWGNGFYVVQCFDSQGKVHTAKFLVSK